ncbi:MAG: hypothetical protein JSS65_05095 [Armatimonadetes bacterium]|nr:hypothetical protein [Armatimonadota bacterium]
MIPVQVKQINLKRRAAWCAAIVLGSGVLAYLMVIVMTGVLWQGQVQDAEFFVMVYSSAMSNAVAWMAITGVVCFVYLGMSFGRWLSLRVTPPKAPEFEATEYPRKPIEVR